MDEVSRVKDIKQRFERFNNVHESNEIVKNGQQNLRTPHANIKKVTANVRPNIKRKPAFRRDKIPVRNNDLIDKTKSSIVSSRVHLFNALDDVENENNADCNSLKSVDDGPRSVSKLAIDFTELYSQVVKPSKNVKIKKSPIEFSNSINNTENTICDRRITNSKVITDGTRDSKNNVNKENDFFSMNKRLPTDISDDLSDTLKRVLRSPLPPGPPPKKPPRTFCSTSNANSSVSDRNSRKNETEVNCGTFRNTLHRPKDSPLSSIKIQQPLRSKTESEIKLKKIENALNNHKIQILSPKLTARKISSTSLPEKASDRCAGIHKNKRRSSDMNTVNQLSSCLSDLNCTTRSKNVQFSSMPYMPSSIQSTQAKDDPHIYEDPTNLNFSSASSCKETEENNRLYYMSTPIDSIIKSNKGEIITETRNLNVKLNHVLDTHFDKEVDDKSQNTFPIDNKIKMWMNEAYGQSWAKTSDASSDSDSVFSTSHNELISENRLEGKSNDEYAGITLSRKGYCQRVASRTISRNQSMLTQAATDYIHLFECLLLVGLNLDAHNEKVPYIKMKYPKHVNVPQSIEHMCFPDAHDWYNKLVNKSNNEDIDEDRFYVIPLTNEAGIRKYVYCRRIKPEGESFSLPLSYCILSGHKANEFYFAILEEVENRHGQSELEFYKFIKGLYLNKFPRKGQGIKISCISDGGNEKITNGLLIRSADKRLDDLRLTKTLAYLKINIFILIFSSLLLERKVILLSNCISKLSTCIEGLQIALLPFEWQHTLITVVPSNLISVADLCDAPTPYLIGLLKPKNNPSHVLSQFNNKIEVLVVDLDEKKVLRKIGDENSILPNHLARSLKRALQLIQSNNLLACCEAFTRLFVEAVGHYQRFIVPSGNDLSQTKTFQKEAFVKAAKTHQIRMFLEWFVETAAFSMFINVRLRSNSQSKELFERRCNQYLEELSKCEKNNKLNKTVKQIGDLIKDWTNSSS